MLLPHGFTNWLHRWIPPIGQWENPVCLKRFGAAVPHLQRCLQNDKSSGLRLLLASAYFGDKNYAAAAETYAAILEEEPANWKARLAYAHFLAMCPDAEFANPSLAEKQLLDLIDDPNTQLTNSSACYVATILAKLGNSERAVKLLSIISNEDEAAKQLLTAIEDQTIRFDLIGVQVYPDDSGETILVRPASFPISSRLRNPQARISHPLKTDNYVQSTAINFVIGVQCQKRFYLINKQQAFIKRLVNWQEWHFSYIYSDRIVNNSADFIYLLLDLIDDWFRHKRYKNINRCRS